MFDSINWDTNGNKFSLSVQMVLKVSNGYPVHQKAMRSTHHCSVSGGIYFTLPSTIKLTD